MYRHYDPVGGVDTIVFQVSVGRFSDGSWEATVPGSPELYVLGKSPKKASKRLIKLMAKRGLLRG